ncbi:MAG: ABC transporter transmembrane domain-containing protein [Hyphomicrobiales bacterium]
MSSLAINLLGLAMPLVVLQIYDRVIPNQASSTLTMFLVMLAVVFLLEAVLKIARYAIMGYGAMAFALSVSNECYSRLLVHEGGFQKLSERNDSLNAVQKIAEYYSSQSRLALVDLPFMIINVVLMAMIGGVVVLAPVGIIAAYGISVSMAGKRLFAQYRKRDESEVRTNDFLTEILRNIETIKSLGAEEVIKRRHERLQKTTGPILYELIKASDRAFVMTSTLGSMATLGVLTLGGLLAAEGHISTGAVACCSLLTGRMMQSASRVISISNDVQAAEAARQMLQPALDLPPVGETTIEAVHWSAAPEIRAAAAVTPHGGDAAVRLDLQIAPGECLVIANAGAAGTHILRSLAGLETVEEGRILVAGETLRHDGAAPYADLAFVSRDLSFFNGSIVDNLTLGGHVNIAEEAGEVAQLLLLDERVALLPLGYETPLRDGSGNLLPAGVLKQVVLTRALMRLPKLVILDEPQTYLDQAADEALIRYLASLRGEATIIIATSRPSYFALADQLVRIEAGSLAPARDAAPPGRTADPPAFATAPAASFGGAA